MSVARHHAEWLSLVETSGPFISLPVLLRVFPQGLDPREPEQAKQLRLAYEEWQDNPSLAGKQRSWINFVLTQALGYPQELLLQGQTLPPALSATMAEYGETLRPDVALVGPAGGDLSGKPQLLIRIYDAEQALDKPVAEKHWKATPATRMMELIHAADVPLGLITNGEQWMLVFASRGETTGFTTWLASLWIDEPITLRAFLSLLGVRRFFGVAPKETLLELLKESASNQQEVTDQLGDQVRDAVEVLIQAFDQLDQGSDRMLLKGVDEKSLYDSALTVMMRLVFLFSAEERGLLHLGKPIYDENYAVSTLREQLQDVADLYGEEVLERRNDAWARLLATFRAVHAGVNHQDLMLPSYGGSLFDPDRYPFLEGRPLGSRWHSKPAEPLEINNRVVLHLLKSLQMLQVRVPGGGPAEARRISFRALDIESIGRIYEGLLDHTAIRTKEVVLGLAASRKKPVASMALSEIEKLMQDKPKLVEALEEETGKQAKSLEKALNSGAPNEFHKVLVACRQDQKLAERIIQFGGLLRQDSFERPVIVLPGGIYVGQGSARRSTGTHYTPSSLTEPIVQHTLEPLVYQGPVDGMPKEQWQLKSPKEILDLKVCDMAMGSGAFLVQACRYLSERLVESWENLENAHPGEVLITPEGQFSQGEPSERLIPKDAAERLAIARRLVADRCIYGVDINPMAVEMAKLSIWLITVDKTRPFTFLDHALKCGDSLLGISSLQQIENFSLRAGEHQITFSTANLFRYVEEASAKRKALEAIPSDRFDQIEAKNMLYQEAESATAKLKAVASCVVSFELRALDGQDYDDQRTIAADATEFEMHKALADFQAYVRKQLREYVPLHWALEFPEVFDAGGFDAVIGNPPFLGGKRISTVHGDHYEQYLKSVFARSKGAADLCCYFFRKAFSLLKKRGAFGLLATKSIAEGDSRDVGIQALLDSGATMYRARKAFPWPGTAGVVAALVHAAKGPFGQPYILNEQEVFSISSFLDAGSHSQPYKLGGSGVLFSQGTTVNGDGFILDLEEANELLRKDNRNRDVIRPYLNGEMFNNSADFQPSRFVIDFETRSEQEARSYADPFVIVEERVRAHRDTLTRQVHESRFWLFWDKREAFYKAIRPKARVLVCAIVTKHLAFQFTNTDWVFSHQLKIFDTQSYGVFGLLQSSLHEVWARKFISRLGGTLRYSTSDAFETFPFPTTSVAEGVAREYHECRSKVMLARNEGLTKVYNRFHHPNDQSEDVVQLRLLHVKLDESVITAYGWNDLRLNHRFQDVGDGLRYTVDEAARNAVMERLMELNHRSHEMKAIARVGKKLTARSKLSAGNKRTEKRTGQNPLF